MIEAGWSRPRELIVLDEDELLALPWPDAEALRRLVDSGYLRERGVDVWRETGWRERIGFRFPAEVPCVTMLAGQ